VQPHGVSEVLVCVPDHDGLFAAITAVLDEMALDVMSARVLTTNDGRSYDLFQVMDQHGDVINDVDAGELVSRLEVATSEEQPRAPVQRKIPRRLRHFTAPPVVQFSDDPDGAGTVLRLECNDQPGLLSRIAAAIYSQNVQVHNARIATFGEKVEDTFLVSDSDHRPLAPGAMETLAESIRRHLEQG
jgi:[protein-PII] uridylyltransferase